MTRRRQHKAAQPGARLARPAHAARPRGPAYLVVVSISPQMRERNPDAPLSLDEALRIGKQEPDPDACPSRTGRPSYDRRPQPVPACQCGHAHGNRRHRCVPRWLAGQQEPRRVPSRAGSDPASWPTSPAEARCPDT